MGPEVEENSAAGAGPFTPSVHFQHGAVTIVMRFKAHEPAERVLLQEFAERLKIGVKAAVVVGGQQAAVLAGDAKEFDSLVGVGDERLVEHNVAARLQAQLGEGEMCLVGGGNHNQAYRFDRE